MASFDLHDPSTYQVAKHDIPFNFSYSVTAEYIDTLTGQPTATQVIQIKSQDLLTINDIISSADQTLSSREYAFSQAVASGALRLDLTVTKALINPNVAI